jgi:phosphoribosyl 1,2-cyclic phosphodiesterase
MFVATSRTRVLIDAGLSKKEIAARLASIGEDIKCLDAVLVTHEHCDHVSGLIPVLNESKAAVFMTHLTAPMIEWGKCVPKLETFQAGCRISIGDMEIDSFTIPHDAVDPVGFCVRAEGIKIGIATDLGYIPDSVKVHLRSCNLLLLESNHELEMLKTGPYPWSVKQRVMGRKGHLSNEVACQFLRTELDTTTDKIILGHLSEHNNHPALVHQAAEQALLARSLFTSFEVVNPGRQSTVHSY